MNPAQIKELQFDTYTPAHLEALKVTKERIRRIIAKYIPTDDDGTCQVWDDLNTMQEDTIQISSLLTYVSPLIGHLDGLSESMDDIKKLTMAKARTIIESTTPASTDEDSETKTRRPTEKAREAESRVAAEEIIISNMNLRATAVEYRKFQFQVNSWIETLRYRIKLLHDELMKGRG